MTDYNMQYKFNQTHKGLGVYEIVKEKALMDNDIRTLVKISKPDVDYHLHYYHYLDTRGIEESEYRQLREYLKAFIEHLNIEDSVSIFNRTDIDKFYSLSPERLRDNVTYDEMMIKEKDVDRPLQEYSLGDYVRDSETVVRDYLCVSIVTKGNYWLYNDRSFILAGEDNLGNLRESSLSLIGQLEMSKGESYKSSQEQIEKAIESVNAFIKEQLNKALEVEAQKIFGWNVRGRMRVTDGLLDFKTCSSYDILLEREDFVTMGERQLRVNDLADREVVDNQGSVKEVYTGSSIEDCQGEMSLLDLLDYMKGKAYIDIETFKDYQSMSKHENVEGVEDCSQSYSLFNGYTFNSLGTNLNIEFRHRVKMNFSQEELRNVKLDEVMRETFYAESIKLYSLIRNGVYTVPYLIMHLDEEMVFNLMTSFVKSETMVFYVKKVEDSPLAHHKKVWFDLGCIEMVRPLVSDSFHETYNKFVDLSRHKAIVKVLKDYKKGIVGEFTHNFRDLDSLQVDFLKSKGIDSKMLYCAKRLESAKSKQEEYGIRFTIKGASSMPSVSKIQNLYHQGKLSTKFYERIMLRVVQDCEYDKQNKSSRECLEEWDKLLKASEIRIKQLETELNLDKFKRFICQSYWYDCTGEYGKDIICQVKIMPREEKLEVAR